MDQGKATQWAIVWIAMGAGIVAATHLGKLPPALTAIREDLGVDLVAAGWIASIVSATSFVLGLVAGAVADRIGQRRVVLFGLAALATGSLAGSFATTGTMLLAARFIEGFGFAATTIAAPGLIAQATHPRDRKRVLGMWAAYFPIGFAGFLLVAPVVVAIADWRALWRVDFAVTIVWFVVLWRATAHLSSRNTPGGKPETVLRNVALTLAQPGALLAAACFGLYAAQHVTLVIWLPTMITDIWATGMFVAAAVPIGVLLFNAGGNLLASWVMGRGAPIWLVMVVGATGMGLCELGIFSAALPDSARLVLAMAFGLFGGLLPAAALASAPVYAPSPAQIGTVNGLLVMGTATGQLFGPPVLAAVKQMAGSWESAGGLMVALAVSVVVLALFSRSFERKVETPG